MSRFRVLCGGVTATGAPCRKAASHVWRGRHSCCWHGDPARRQAAVANHHRYRWSIANLETLYYLTERGWTDDRIARKLGCSTGAIRRARYDHRLAPKSRIQLNAVDVAQMLGYRSGKTVKRWIDAGIIPAQRGERRGRQTQWLISYDALEAFLADERYWHLWSPDRVANQTLVDDSGRPRHLRYLTASEVAAICGVERQTPNKWFTKGWLRAVLHGTTYYTRSDWLDEFRRVWSYGDGIGEHRHAA